jgi:hypothetical protein
MAGLCYVTPVTGHKAYTGKEEEEDHFPYDSVLEKHCCVSFLDTHVHNFQNLNELIIFPGVVSSRKKFFIFAIFSYDVPFGRNAPFYMFLDTPCLIFKIWKNL